MSGNCFDYDLIRETFNISWKIMKQHLLLSLIIFFVFLCNYIFNNTIITQYNSDLTYLSLIINLIVFVFLTKTAFILFDNRKTTIKEVFSLSILINSIVCYLLYGIILSIGLLLLVIPGIIWGLRLIPALYLVIDNGLGPFDAIKRSWIITKGFTLSILTIFSPFVIIGYYVNHLLLTFGIFSFVGLLVLSVSFVVNPIGFFVLVVLCRKLNAQQLTC